VSLPRLIAPFLATMALAVPSAALAQSGSAGDEQYQDPFADSTQTQTTTTPSSSGSQGSGLSQTADLAGSSNGSGSAAGTPSQLPDTGTDPRLLALAGIALLLAGIGLRLRTADGRF